MSFDELGLRAELLQAVAKQGYTQPTPIQRQSIPFILQGRDILAGAQTGTGKTASFTLPLLQRLMLHFDAHQHPKIIRALVLVPTRELAIQVDENIKLYGAHLPLKTLSLFGGVSIGGQIRTLRHGADIIVATPGRLLDLIKQRVVHLSKVETVVLDEADRMLDMGFLPDVQRVLNYLPKQKQSLLFSATLPDAIKGLAKNLLRDPIAVEVAQQHATADNISELIYAIKQEHKRELISYLIGHNNWQQVLVFVRTKHGADRLEKQLIRDGIRTLALHGDKTQAARNKALDFFKTNKVSVLVATDVASRGIDIDNLPHVINFDLPQVAQDYVHRIGRTGRAGMSGTAISLVCPEEAYLLTAIENLLKRKIPRVADTGYEPISLNDRPKKSAKPNQKKDYRHKKKKVASQAKKTGMSKDKKPKRPKKSD